MVSRHCLRVCMKDDSHCIVTIYIWNQVSVQATSVERNGILITAVKTVTWKENM